MNRQVAELQSRELTKNYTIQKLEQEVDMVKQQNEWLNKELETVRSEFSNYRKEKIAQVGQLQAEVEKLSNDKTTFEQQYLSAKRTNTDLLKKCDDLTKKCEETEFESQNTLSSFKSEMEAQKRLAELYKSRSEHMESRSNEMESIVSDLESNLAASRSRLNEIEDVVRAKEAEYQTIIDAKDLDLERLSEEMSQLRNMIESGVVQRPDESIASLSPAAAMASRIQKEGKTFTEIYAENMHLRDDMMKSKSENSRLKEMLNTILREVEERANGFQREREEHQQILKDRDTLANELTSKMQDLESKSKSLTVLSQRLDAFDTQNKHLLQETRDLARQVTVLLRELDAIQKGYMNGTMTAEEREQLRTMSNTILENAAKEGRLVDGDNENDESRGFGGMATIMEEGAGDRFVSDNLVVYRNVDELQVQNQRLLRIIRELTHKAEHMESEFKKKQAQLESQELSKSIVRIETLQTELSAVKTQGASIKRERDELKRKANELEKHLDVLAKSGSLGSAVSTVRSRTQQGEVESIETERNEWQSLYEEKCTELENTKNQLKELEVDVTMTRESEDLLRRELAVAKSETEKLRTRNATLEERNTRLNAVNESREREAGDYRNKIAELIEKLTTQDGSYQTMMHDVYSLKESLQVAKMELLNFKSEKEIWQKSEARLLSENQSLVQERSRLNELMKSLQTMQNDFEKTESEMKRRAERRVESLEKELQVTKQRLHDTLDDNRALSIRKENELKDYHLKLDKITADFQVAREELVVSKNNAQHLQKRIDELTSTILIAEEKLAVYESGRRTGAPTATTSATEAESSSTQNNRERELEMELADVRSQLVALRQELATAKEHVEQFKSIAKSNEEALASLNSTFDSYKAEMEKRVTDANAEIASLTASRDGLNEQLLTTAQEVTGLQEKLDGEKLKWEGEHKLLEERMQHLVDSEQEAVRARQQALDDLRAQVKIAQEHQENYERELVNHANDVQSLSKMKDDLVKLREEYAQLRQRAEVAESNLKNSQTSWEGQKSLLEKSIEEMEKRCQDLQTQNGILHSQLDQVTAQAQRIQQRATSLDAGEIAEAAEVAGETGGSDKTIEELREVIRFLRREKEILQCQHEVSLQENQRSKQQIDHLQKSIEETRAILDEERNRAQTAYQTTLNQNELMEKINQLNILRESNVTLREENEKNMKKAGSLEVKLKEVERTTEPLKEEVRTLQAELEAKASEIKTLEEDCARWRTRSQQILAKYERIDPVEHQKLKEDTQALRAEVDSLKAVKFDREKEMDSVKEKLNVDWQARVDVITGHLNVWKERSTQFQTQMKLKDGQIQEITDAQKKIVEELTKTKEELTKLKEEASKAVQVEKDTKSAEVSLMETRMRNVLAAKVMLEKQMKEVESKHQEEIQTLKTQITQAQQQVETKLKEAVQIRENEVSMRFKAKMSMMEGLNKKLVEKVQLLENKVAIPITAAPPVAAKSVVVTPAPTVSAASPLPKSPQPTLATKRAREEDESTAPATTSTAATPVTAASATGAVATSTTILSVPTEPAAKRAKVVASPTAPSPVPVVEQPVVEESQEAVDEDGAPQENQEYAEGEEVVEGEDGFTEQYQDAEAEDQGELLEEVVYEAEGEDGEVADAGEVEEGVEEAFQVDSEMTETVQESTEAPTTESSMNDLFPSITTAETTETDAIANLEETVETTAATAGTIAVAPPVETAEPSALTTSSPARTQPEVTIAAVTLPPPPTITVPVTTAPPKSPVVPKPTSAAPTTVATAAKPTPPATTTTTTTATRMIRTSKIERPAQGTSAPTTTANTSPTTGAPRKLIPTGIRKLVSVQGVPPGAKVISPPALGRGRGLPGRGGSTRGRGAAPKGRGGSGGGTGRGGANAQQKQ